MGKPKFHYLSIQAREALKRHEVMSDHNRKELFTTAILPKGNLVKVVDVAGKHVLIDNPRVHHATTLQESSAKMLKEGLQEGTLVAPEARYSAEFIKDIKRRGTDKQGPHLEGLDYNPFMIISLHVGEENKFQRNVEVQGLGAGADWPATKNNLEVDLEQALVHIVLRGKNFEAQQKIVRKQLGNHPNIRFIHEDEFESEQKLINHLVQQMQSPIKGVEYTPTQEIIDWHKQKSDKLIQKASEQTQKIDPKKENAVQELSTVARQQIELQKVYQNIADEDFTNLSLHELHAKYVKA